MPLAEHNPLANHSRCLPSQPSGNSLTVPLCYAATPVRSQSLTSPLAFAATRLRRHFSNHTWQPIYTTAHCRHSKTCRQHRVTLQTQSSLQRLTCFETMVYSPVLYSTPMYILLLSLLCYQASQDKKRDYIVGHRRPFRSSRTFPTASSSDVMFRMGSGGTGKSVEPDADDGRLISTNDSDFDDAGCAAHCRNF